MAKYGGGDSSNVSLGQLVTAAIQLQHYELPNEAADLSRTGTYFCTAPTFTIVVEGKEPVVISDADSIASDSDIVVNMVEVKRNERSRRSDLMGIVYRNRRSGIDVHPFQ